MRSVDCCASFSSPPRPSGRSRRRWATTPSSRGAKVGGAEVKIETDDARYEISGKAWTVGVLNFVTQWQSMFSSTGRLADSGPVNDGYRFIETRPRQGQGTAAQRRSPDVRQERPGPVAAQAPTSIDLLSALFVVARLRVGGFGRAQRQRPVLAEADSITKRCRRRRTAPPSAARSKCNNKDNERIDATIWLGQVDGLTVPIRLDLAGAMEGTLKLNTSSSGDSSELPGAQTAAHRPTIQI